MSSRVFFDGGELDRAAVWREAVPLARLVAVAAVAVFVPVTVEWLVVETLGLVPVLATLLSLVTQFVAAVGGAVVLLYVVARGVALGTA